jgi:hypothetical protein
MSAARRMVEEPGFRMPCCGNERMSDGTLPVDRLVFFVRWREIQERVSV